MKINYNKPGVRVRVSKVSTLQSGAMLMYFKTSRKNKEEKWVDSLFIARIYADALKNMDELASVLAHLEKWEDGNVKNPVPVILKDFQILREAYEVDGKKTYPVTIQVYDFMFTDTAVTAPVQEELNKDEDEFPF